MSAASNLAQHFVFIESPPDLLLIYAPFGTSGHKSETHPSPHFRSTRLWLTSHSLPFRLSFVRIKLGQAGSKFKPGTNARRIYLNLQYWKGALNAFQTIQHNRRWWSQSERTEPRPSSWMWSVSRRNGHMTCHLPQCRLRVRDRHNLCLPMPMMSGRISSRHHPTPLLRRNGNQVDNKADHNRNVPVSSNQVNMKPHRPTYKLRQAQK